MNKIQYTKNNFLSKKTKKIFNKLFSYLYTCNELKKN